MNLEAFLKSMVCAIFVYDQGFFVEHAQSAVIFHANLSGEIGRQTRGN